MNSVLNNLRRRRQKTLRAWMAHGLVVSHLLTVSPAYSVNMGQLQGMTGFKAMVLAVANLNIAMKYAAVNPMDINRRNKVAIAYRMMPVAVTALAKDFKEGKLHDGYDYQFVQGILGGFVQKDLTSKVEAFMKDPSHATVPQVGSQFPQSALKQADSEYIVADKPNFSDSSASNAAPSMDKGSQGPDLVDLNRTQASVATTTNGESSLLSSTTPSFSGAPSLVKSGSAFQDELDRDIRSIEASLYGKGTQGNQGLNNRAPAETTSSASGIPTVNALGEAELSTNTNLDKDFLSAKKTNSQQEKKTTDLPAPHSIRKGSILERGASLSPYGARRHWVSYLWQILMPQASAECNQGQCGNGQGGGGGGGGGGNSAEILFGLAAVMAATSPMIAAMIQANADQNISQMNAESAAYQAQLQFQLQQQAVGSQTQVAMTQAAATQQMAQQKNQNDLSMFQMAQSVMQQQQAQQSALQQQQMATAQANQQQELALKVQQTQAQIQLAQQQAQMAIVEQGLTTGIQTQMGPPMSPMGRLSYGQQIGPANPYMMNSLSGGRSGVGSLGLAGSSPGLAPNGAGQVAQAPMNLGGSLSAPRLSSAQGLTTIAATSLQTRSSQPPRGLASQALVASALSKASTSPVTAALAFKKVAPTAQENAVMRGIALVATGSTDAQRASSTAAKAITAQATFQGSPNKALALAEVPLHGKSQPSPAAMTH